jgi:hypothetical protein
MIAYILILVLAVAIVVLYKKVRKLEDNQMTIEEFANGDTIIKFKGKTIYNTK